VSAPGERGGGRRRRVGAGLAVALALGLGSAWLPACFHPEVLAYTACSESDSCAEAGLFGCLRLPTAAAVRGSCTLACEADADCPAAPGGDARVRCAEVDGTPLCVLSCMDEETCPESQVCTRVGGVDGEEGRLCFPVADDGGDA
jgi:hypothetical protein